MFLLPLQIPAALLADVISSEAQHVVLVAGCGLADIPVNRQVGTKDGLLLKIDEQGFSC